MAVPQVAELVHRYHDGLNAISVAAALQRLARLKRPQVGCGPVMLLLLLLLLTLH